MYISETNLEVSLSLRDSQCPHRDSWKLLGTLWVKSSFIEALDLTLTAHFRALFKEGDQKRKEISPISHKTLL